MCPQIYVNTGVEIPDGIGESLTQDLKDSIQIGIDVDDSVDLNKCHFLQFITHQMPDMYSYKKEQLVSWEEEISNCTIDSKVPRWSVDSDSYPSPFYEPGGAHIIADNTCCIYDKPGYGIPMPAGRFERIIGCTFVIVNNQVVNEVRWSRQFEVEVVGENLIRSTYTYSIHEASKLPDWALHTLKDEYETNGSLNKKIYIIPEYLDRQDLEEPAEALKDAGESFLPPPPNWVLLHDRVFSSLYTPQQAEEQQEIEKHPSSAFN